MLILRNSSFSDFNAQLYRNCHLPANMTEGSEVKLFGGNNCNPLQAFEECFTYLSSKSQDDGFLILFDSLEFHKERELRRERLKCNCRDKIGILRIIGLSILLQELGRDEPLFHTREKFTSGREKIKEHNTIVNPLTH